MRASPLSESTDEKGAWPKHQQAEMEGSLGLWRHSLERDERVVFVARLT